MSGLRSVISWLADQLFPAACPLCCGNFADHGQQLFCATCLPGFKPLPLARCNRCALPFQTLNGRSHLCGRCTLHPPPFSKVYCAGLYALSLRKAIHQFKFNQRVNLDQPLAQLLDRAIDTDCRCELIIPLPLHPRRLRQRSYNQSLLLARQISRLRSLPVAAGLLQKVRDTPPQQGLSAREREQNLRQAFALAGDITGARVLLVDDVMTTGTTAAAAGEVLLQGGAADVQVAVVGRAPNAALHL